MYIEKEFLLRKINEYCEINNIEMSFGEKYRLSTEVSRKLDEERLLTEDEFLELLEHNQELEIYNDIDFDDEIIDIQEIGEEETIDFNVSGNHLFYANGILTHNSAVNSTDASNDSVSDSLGTVQTADFMLFLLQTEEMKAQKKILCKVTKNRFNGRTDSWEMDVDYQYMRFQDSNKLTINPNDGNILDLVNDDLKANINIIKASNSKNNVLNDDFGLMMNDINSQDVKEIQESRETKILSADDELNKLLGL